MKDEIDDSERAVRELQTEIEEHTQRAEDAEKEAKELDMKLREMEDIKGDMEDETKAVKQKMDEIETESDENKRFRRVLESRGNTNSEKLVELQTQLTQQTEDIERLDRQNQELSHKAQEMEDALEDTEEKGLRLKSILDDNQEEIGELRNNYKSLLARKKKMAERLSQLQTQEEQIDNDLSENLHRAENAEDCCRSLTNQIGCLEDELEAGKHKLNSTQQELDQIELEIGGM